METKENSLPIYIKINEEKVTNNTSYTILGTKISKPIERTFKEFIILREKLVERWPGIIIPNISLKENIEMRIDMLNSFCMKIYQKNYLFNSEEVNIFLKQSNDWVKNLNSLEKLNYERLIKKYSGIFTSFDDNFDTQYEKGEQDKFYKDLKENLTNLENIKNLFFSSLEKYKLNHSHYNIIENIFSLYEKDLLSEYSNNDGSKFIFLNNNNKEFENKLKLYKENTKNPFENIYKLLLEDYLNAISIKEGIESINNLQEEYDKLAKTFTDKNTEIIDLQAGKNILKTLFSFKNRETSINDAVAEKDKIEKNLNNLNQIIKISIFNMQSEISNFKFVSIDNYYNELKEIENDLENNLNIENHLWENIIQDNNIKQLE
jgi:hypothetical protein